MDLIRNHQDNRKDAATSSGGQSGIPLYQQGIAGCYDFCRGCYLVFHPTAFPFPFVSDYLVTTARTTFPRFIMAGAHPLRDVITHGYDARRTAPPAQGMAHGPCRNRRP